MTQTYALSVGNGQYSVGSAVDAAPNTTTAAALLATGKTSAAAMSSTATESAVAVLEADDASPTQAHVNSLRTVWNTLAALIATAKTDVAAISLSSVSVTLPSGDIVLVLDTSVISNMNKVKASLDAIYRHLDGSGLSKA